MILYKRSLLISFLAFSIFLSASAPLAAQNLERVEKQAIRSFKRANYVKARDQFLVLYDSGWNQVSTSSYLASCYLELNDPAKSYDILSTIDTDSKDVDLLKIRSAFSLEKFDEAENLINNFGDTTGYQLQPLIDKLLKARDSYANEKGYLIQNFGSSVNSKDMEYSAVMFDDYNKLLYTVRKEGTDISDGSGMTFETVYSTEIDSTDTWQSPIPLDISVQGKRSHDATVQIYDAGNKMISYHDGRLYISSLKDGVLSKEEFLELHSEDEAVDTHCFITPDENTLYFASDFGSVGNDLDLYVTTKGGNGRWSEPEPLSNLNTRFDEDSPFIANDGTFYFSSRGHNSMGGYDIFKSSYDSLSAAWSDPVNLGSPINSVAEDIYYTTEGKVGYMSSSRLGGFGSLDLYRVFLFNKVKVSGKLLDDNGQPVVDATIDIKYDTTSLQTFTDEKGDYEMYIPINKNIHTTFIKDSLNLFEGDYIVNIFFKDQNDNEFNFYVDYLDADPLQSKGVKEVEHINIEVKNDYTFNPVISSVDKKNEKVWADSVNVIFKERQLQRREISLLKIENDNLSILSKNLNLKAASVRRKNETRPQNAIADEQAADKLKEEELLSGFVVQILALTIPRQPPQAFFERIDQYQVEARDGKDGLRRFFIGNFGNRKEARELVKSLKKSGYDDVFIRKAEKYLSL